MHLKISSAKWRPFCLGLNVLNVMMLCKMPSYIGPCYSWNQHHCFILKKLFHYTLDVIVFRQSTTTVMEFLAKDIFQVHMLNGSFSHVWWMRFWFTETERGMPVSVTMPSFLKSVANSVLSKSYPLCFVSVHVFVYFTWLQRSLVMQ